MLLTVLVRLSLLRAPLSPDEAGFLMVADQWSPGTSLYGDYWVDRPPGLIALFGVADAAGGQAALRLIGALAAGAAVLSAALLARHLAPSRRAAPALVAALVTAFVSNPLLDVTMVNGEILALPLLLTGIWLLLRAVAGPPGWRAAGLAGACGVGAASVKQNMVDVAVVAVVLVVALLARRRRRDAAILAGTFTIGGLVVGAALLALASSRGTSFGGLWEAIVVFRGQASAVIATQASAATGERAARLALALLATGAPATLLLGARIRWARTSPRAAQDPVLTWVTVVVLGWETLGIVAGGSYWLHYLVGLVPGLALVMCLSLGQPQRRRRPRTAWQPTRPRVGTHPHAWTLLMAVASTVIGLGVLTLHPPARPQADQAVIDYLTTHRAPGDAGVTAFGNPALLQQAGLSSPYPHLWSLPVRVQDPTLTEFADLLADANRPTWIIMSGVSLATWGVDASIAEPLLADHYKTRFTSGDLTVLRRRP